MPEQTNPAKRLHDILDRVVSYGAEEGYMYSSQRQENVPREMREVWMEAMEIDPDEEDAEDRFHNSLSEVLLLINSCEQIVKRTSAMDQDLHLEQLTQAKRVIFRVHATIWNEFRDEFNVHFMRSLQWAARDMTYHWDEEIISEESLATLQEGVEDIINRVVDSDLEYELKRVLIDGLEAVRQALLNYQMSGAEGIRQALDRNIGLLHRYREDFKVAYESDDQQVVVDFFGFLKKADIVVSPASKIKQLAAPIIDRMLESSG